MYIYIYDTVGKGTMLTVYNLVYSSFTMRRRSGPQD